MMIVQLKARRYLICKPIIALSSVVLTSIVILHLTSGIKNNNQVLGFHLSFGHRILKSISNPQLNPASTLIRPIECRNANNNSEFGICMFSIDCMQNKGTPLSVCKHNYFVGTCCRLPDYNNFVGIVYDLRDTETNQLLEARKFASEAPSTAQAFQSISSNQPAAAQSGALIISTPSTNQQASESALKLATSHSQQFQQDNQQQSITRQTFNVSVTERQPIERLEDKYMISSTSLFASSQQPAVTAPSVQLASSQQKIQQEAPQIKPNGPSQTSESARNADGGLSISSSGPLLALAMSNRHQPVAAASELDSFQIQTSQQLTGAAAALNHTLAQQQTVSAPTSGGSLTKDISNQASAALDAKSAATVQVVAANNQQQHSAYELIRDNSLEVLSTLNSAHSPISGSTAAATAVVGTKQANEQQQQQQHLVPTGERSDGLSTGQRKAAIGSEIPIQLVPAQNTGVYFLDAFADQQQQQQNNIVFANNHQQPNPTSNTTHRPQVETNSTPSGKGQQHQSSQAATSDQEFTLSSLPSLEIDESAHSSRPAVVVVTELLTKSSLSNHQSTSSSAKPLREESKLSTSAAGGATATANDDFNVSTPIAFSPQWSSSSSPYVDLISSNSAQTTTPFTTSLSTALLPNVSSHPYSPTTVPSVAIAGQQSPNPTSNSPPTSTSTPSSIPTSSSSLVAQQNFSPTAGFNRYSHPPLYAHYASSPSNRPSERPNVEHPASLSPLGSVSQLHHSSSSGMLHAIDPGHSSFLAGGANGRPSLLANSPPLHPSTKIVTGGSAGNNLIPGLSGLQSAILSHIPFKLASGLSSGLSNYLQAAMKQPPAGGRPLLSSNTAPSLQYQQQMQQQQQQAANATVIKAATAASVSTSAAASSTQSNLRFPSTAQSSQTAAQLDTTVADKQAAYEQPNTTTTTVAPSVSPGARSPAQVSFDVVREAQMVCGRPQVSQTGNMIESRRRIARIVGGNQSLFGQWPWMVSLRQWRKGAFLHKCGAALLNENWAITAAHCVEKFSNHVRCTRQMHRSNTNVKASDLLLRLGEFDVSSQDEPYPYIERRVKSVVSHPSFDPKTFEYDLALLRFAEPIRFERNIIPVCVPSGNDTYVDRMATVIGWGRLYEDGPLPDVIQHVDVPIITNNECEKMYRNAGFIEEIPEMFICAGISKGGRDSCEGDSGGPLTMVDHDGRSYLVGIISWGIGCALPSQPGVYTRITAFSGWINQITAF